MQDRPVAAALGRLLPRRLLPHRDRYRPITRIAWESDSTSTS